MSRDEPLLELLRMLKLRNYRFTALTPATHARVLERKRLIRRDLRDIFGWNMEFDEADLDPHIFKLLQHADALETTRRERFKSRIRVASLKDELFIHSAFPTADADAVFFGPDTYRFVAFVERQLPRCDRPRHVLDMGAGSGAGGIIIARLCERNEVTLVDINNRALTFARLNAEAAGLPVNLVHSSLLPPGADLIIANPPYMMDPLARSYRDGGELLGGAVALDWLRQALSSMNPAGVMLLYTGAAYVGGRSPLLEALSKECRGSGAEMVAEEIDPDVFGEELSEPVYASVERIAAVGIRVERAFS